MYHNLKFTKKDLLMLPNSQSNEIKTYSGLLVCKSGKHSSGYATMLIVGLNDYTLKNAKIVSKNICDSIQWYNDDNLHFASDMHFQSGIIHFFSSNGCFEVTKTSCSMVDIYLLKKSQNNDCEWPF